MRLSEFNQQLLWCVDTDYDCLAPLLFAGIEAQARCELLQIVGLVEGPDGELQVPAQL